MSNETLSDQIARMNREELNAAKAEAVLAFARLANGGRHAKWLLTAAKAFIQSHGWSETPGQAERGKP